MAIRKTWGWADPTTSSGRKEADRISYSQFMEGTGIKGRGTLSAALKDCLDRGYLLRRQVGTDARSGNPLFSYALNTEWRPAEAVQIAPLASGTEIVPLSGTEIVPLSGTEIVPTKERKERKKALPADLTEEEQSSFDRLLTVPRMDPTVARKLAKSCEPSEVASWVEHVKRAEDLDSPAALVVARLKAGEPAPTDRAAPRGQDGDGDRRRFISGESGPDINY